MIPDQNRNKQLWKTCSNWDVLDNISYAITTISNVLDPSKKPLYGVWSHHLKYHEGRSIVPFEKPTQLVGTIKFMHVNFGHLSPRRWRTPSGAGGLIMFIMRRVKLFWVWINIITLEELHESVDFLF
jgi:hypothetical protein